MNAPALDNIGSIYGAGASPSYYSSDLQGPAATTGGNLRTQTAAMPSVNAVTIAPGLDGTIFGQPVTHLFVIALVAIGIYYVIRRTVPGIESKIATPGIGIGSFFSIGVQAVVFIVLTKTVLTKWRIPGLSDVVGAA